MKKTLLAIVCAAAMTAGVQAQEAIAHGQKPPKMKMSTEVPAGIAPHGFYCSSLESTDQNKRS